MDCVALAKARGARQAGLLVLRFVACTRLGEDPVYPIIEPRYSPLLSLDATGAAARFESLNPVRAGGADGLG